MDFVELAYRRCEERWLTVHDYIDWAGRLLDGGCDAPSIAQLASCSWDAVPDPGQVERLFQSSILELGLTLPLDWYEALLAYASSLCRQTLAGTLAPGDLVQEMFTLADDNDMPHMLWIWIDLARDLPGGHAGDSDHIEFNGVLDLDDSDVCIRRTAVQFVALCAMPLADRFPLIWRCGACGAESEESTFSATKTIACQRCAGVSSMRNMRFFEHREQLAGATASPAWPTNGGS